MSDEVNLSKNVTRICPLLSCALSWTTKDKSGKETRHNAMAKSPCVRGECEFFNMMKGKCCLKGDVL